MAIPTITSISPDEGNTRGGYVVRIYGTNFRTPPTPNPTGYIGGTEPKTVSVKFGGVMAEYSAAISDGIIICRPDQWRASYDSTSLPALVDVRVCNLDDNENEIVGEEATIADAFTFGRVDIAHESYFQRVKREVLRYFRRHILLNTHIMMTRDYPDDPAELRRKIASLPAIFLVGPRLPINRFDSFNVMPCEESGVVDWERKDVPVTVDVAFNLHIWTESDRHLSGLVQEFLLTTRDIPWLRIDIDPSDADAGYREHVIEIPWNDFPQIGTGPNIENLYSASSQCVVKGVHMDYETGTVIEQGWTIQDNDGEPSLDLQSEE